MPHDVFISHVEEDADLAVSLAGELELAGFTTWYYERDTLPGPSYLLQVAEAIGDANVVLVVISTHALSSHQVTAEVVRAYECGKPFVPLLLDISHAEFQQRQPIWRQAIGASSSIRLLGSDRQSVAPRIVAGVRRLVGRDTATQAPPRPTGSPQMNGPEVKAPAPLGSQTLPELKTVAEESSSEKERARAIQMIGQCGGHPEIPWFTDLVFRSKRRATLKAAMKQIDTLGGVGAARSLKDIAENHTREWVRIDAALLIPQLDRLSDPEWFKRFLRQTPEYQLRFALLRGLAKEGWSGRLDASIAQVRQFIEDLRQMAETEQHPDVRHTLISIVAHLCRNEPWTREWVLQKAREAKEGYYRTHCYAIGLSVWNDDDAFVQALNQCPKDSTGQEGAMFVRWAHDGDWARYRLHMGGWGPTE